MNIYQGAIRISLFGESHGETIGIIIDGIPAGKKIDYDYISNKMRFRKAIGKISTPRHEKDEFHILSGVLNSFTTGAPLAIVINNENISSKDYSEFKRKPRPSHSDFTANEKFAGFQDFRGGGHFSGRITAPIVAAGAIISSILEEQDIRIGTHISQIQELHDLQFDPTDDAQTRAQINALNTKYFSTISPEIGADMQTKIQEIAKQKDSLGGILETAIVGVSAGLGEPFFDSIESIISHLVFSIPAVKAIEFGGGFELANSTGSKSNDEFYYDENRGVRTKSNNNGGINGGISNGMPIIFRTAIKPTPSIGKIQSSVDLETKENSQIEIRGRHDPFIAHRARVVVDSMAAIAIFDLLKRNNLSNL